ncbi:MAG TPA: B12-binding domain-containing radical SAM protein, partial [Polyangiaceae bacterium]
MQIELIATASEDSAFLPRLGLGVLASLTPAEDEVIYTDDLVKPFDLEKDVKDVDLVGISVDSKTARRSYEIAAAYR